MMGRLDVFGLRGILISDKTNAGKGCGFNVHLTSNVAQVVSSFFKRPRGSLGMKRPVRMLPRGLAPLAVEGTDGSGKNCHISIICG